jgi:fructosamine-3-kinase
LAVSVADAGDLPLLVLEYLEPGPAGPRFDEELGRGLAQLHRAGAERFGLDHDNFIGTLPQDNTFQETWANFYRERRLRPQLKRALDAGLASTHLAQRFDRLFRKLDDLVGPSEAPCRLHGDLWGGNLHCTKQGMPALIDPAVYAGHREVDLAMMRLFGGFDSRVFSAYDEAFQLAPGHDERRSLCQLYPLMVHLNLFGAGYLGAVERALGVYL